MLAVTMSMPAQSEELVNLVGLRVPSEFAHGVVYRLGQRVGRGAMSVAFFAIRCAPEGECPVVFKVAHPDFVRQFGHTAKLAVQKEAVALGRLNERVPSTPFVVRSIDTGALTLEDPWGLVELPWIVLEYVHGGLEGTTLTQRVSKCVLDSDHAFDLERAERAVQCLTKGLAAVHEVGVVHRDLKPGNVLCCGTGADEIFKVADFGVARPEGVSGTFFSEVVGTPGYVAPEAFGSNRAAVGPWTDIFSLAGVIYFLLTGEKYLPVKSAVDMAMLLGDHERRSLLEASRLDPELRRRASTCRAIDKVLAQATAMHPQERHQSIEAFASALLPLMHVESWASRSTGSFPKADSSPVSRIHLPRSTWDWITRYRARDDCAVRRVAWDSDGRCLATTSLGLLFWSGTAWQEVPLNGLSHPDSLRFVHRAGPSRWYVGYETASLASFTVDGMLDTVNLSDRLNTIEAFSGELGDLAVVVERRTDGRYALQAQSAWRWLKPMPLQGAAAITSLSRVGDARWLVTGRNEDGTGLTALYSPLEFELQPIAMPPVRAMMASAGRENLDTGVAGGADGLIAWCEATSCQCERVDGELDISAVAIDSAGTGWAAGAGHIWMRCPSDDSTLWSTAWKHPDWLVPFVSLFADVGQVIGVTADGAILEGRMVNGDPDTEMNERAWSVRSGPKSDGGVLGSLGPGDIIHTGLRKG